MLVTLSGIVMLVRPLILVNDKAGIAVTFSPIFIVVKFVQSSNIVMLKSAHLVAFQLTVARLLQSANALCSILVTLLGIVTLVSPLQFLNAE